MTDPHHAPYIALFPEDALKKSVSEVLAELTERYGERVQAALDPNVQAPSPVGEHTDSNWIKRANTVGINVRTISSFWQVIPYAMTLAKTQNAIHLLPIWEPGVVASLYGLASWNINPEFFSPALAETCPVLDTVEKQLKVVVNLLHLMDKTVGMDVVPHTDRYSEMALAQPQYFEWLQRRDMHILRHNNELWREVRALLFEYVEAMGPAVSTHKMPESETVLFEIYPEETRLEILFGSKYDYTGRLARRKDMVELLYQTGFETVPATMGPPYRGIEVDPDPAAKVVDEEGRVWRDYRITRPEKFSRVFGPLARYKLYEGLNDNAGWALDFSRPNVDAWNYVCSHYKAIQAEFGFDFMRGDMSHVQPRPNGVPRKRDDYYDLLGAVKQHVQQEKPYFGYFAESFLAPPGEMAYGDEVEHLNASFADSTLGDLQSEPIHTPRFISEFARYRKILDKKRVAPNFTVITADKDDPRFDAFYLNGNEARMFMALFLTDMPSYVSMGFECRDPHPVAAPNEHYSKLYVFQMPEGPKGTRGPYVWGKNMQLYKNMVRLKAMADEILYEVEPYAIHWMIGPETETAQSGILLWTQKQKPTYLFAVNLNDKHFRTLGPVNLPQGDWMEVFTTQEVVEGTFQSSLQFDLAPGAVSIWRRIED